ncbi:MAG: hypothetical protein U0Q16_21920 [Bryobacteraceae bacterium]
MYCCAELGDLVDRGMVEVGPLQSLTGRILTEFNTDYHLRFGEDRPSFVGMHYCPFCGRTLSRDLWNREKKK